VDKQLVALLNEGAPTATGDRLDALRNAVRELRNAEAEVTDLEERLRQRKADVRRAQREELPSFFHAAGLTTLTLEPEGNQPAYAVKLSPYVHASIAISAPQEQREKAFGWLEKHGASDLIKRTFTIETGRGEEAKVRKIEVALAKLKVPFELSYEVHWSTLTAWLKEQISKHQPIPPLELIGGDVGEIVQVEKAKVKR
jgi:hypothetical protein